MSASVVWAVPNELIEDAIRHKLKLETQPTIWAVALDDIGDHVCLVIEIDPSEIDKAAAELEIHELEDFGLEN
jgi:hypothetical protein